MDAIRVGALLDDKKFDLRLSLVAGKQGLSRRISSLPHPEARARAGRASPSTCTRSGVQVFGNTEMSYLATLPRERAVEVLRRFFAQDIACLVVTKGLDVPPEMRAAAEEPGSRSSGPRTSRRPSSSRSRTTSRTSSPRRPRCTACCSTSSASASCSSASRGIGKSEIALDLVMRGHRLVADDIVDVKRRAPTSVFGAGSEIIKHHMEIRGLGIINIKDLFGVAAIRERKKIEIVARAGRVGPARRVRPARRRGEEVPHPRRRDPDAASCRSGRAAT